jgi:hypothetical protein
MEESSGRRWFQIRFSLAWPFAAALGADPHCTTATANSRPGGSVKGQSQPQVYGWLTQTEQAFGGRGRAVNSRGELGPGAKEAGGLLFHRSAAGGAYGTMARNYKQGPWPEGTRSRAISLV